SEAARPGLRALYQIGEVVEEAQVPLEGHFDARPQDLHRNFPGGNIWISLPGDGEVHLCNGGCRDRLLVELGEELLERAPQFILDRLLGVLEGEGLQSILQFREVGRHLFADEIRPGSQELTELDAARAQLGQGIGQLLAWSPGSTTGTEAAEQGDGSGENSKGLDRREGVVAP